METISISRSGQSAATAPRRLLRDVDVAARLAISRRRAQYLLERGELPCVRFGRIRRVEAADLEAWVQAHKTPARRVQVEADEDVARSCAALTLRPSWLRYAAGAAS